MRMGQETMGRVRLGAAIALLALLLAGACLRPAPAAATLKTDILRILTKNGVAGSRTGVYVWDIDTGQQVYGRNSYTPLAPASNLKLLTSATALLDWGPDHRFMTGLYGPDGPSPNGTIHGDLYLKGYGDPSLSTLQYQRQVMHIKTSSFEAFAQKLRKLGRAQGQGRRDRRRRLVRQAPHRPGLEARHPGRVRAAVGALRQRRAGRRQPRVGPRQVVGQAADQGAQGSRHQGDGQGRHGHGPGRRHAARDAALGAAERAPQAHEQGQRQLLRRDAAQGPRQGLHGVGHQRRRRRGRARDARDHRAAARRPS